MELRTLLSYISSVFLANLLVLLLLDMERHSRLMFLVTATLPSSWKIRVLLPYSVFFTDHVVSRSTIYV
jgi:hypothetical protein